MAHVSTDGISFGKSQGADHDHTNPKQGEKDTEKRVGAAAFRTRCDFKVGALFKLEKKNRWFELVRIGEIEFVKKIVGLSYR